MSNQSKWSEMVQASRDAKEDLNYFEDDNAIIWAEDKITRLTAERDAATLLRKHLTRERDRLSLAIKAVCCDCGAAENPLAEHAPWCRAVKLLETEVRSEP